MNSEKEPLVSIIVPSYNHSKYIEECIKSIVNQTYTNWELTVIDDGSVDDSVEILKQLSRKYDFRIVQQENRGVSATLNRGIKEFSLGKYFTFCASDDFWMKEKLEKQVAFLEKHPNIPMCFGKTHYVDEKSKIIKKLDHKNKNLQGGDVFGQIFTFKFHPPVNYMLRLSIFKEVGFYDETLFAEDYDMNLRISKKYSTGFIDDYLGYYRHLNIESKNLNHDRLFNSHLITINKYKDHSLYNKAITKLYLNRADVYSRYCSTKFKAIKSLFKSIGLFYKAQYLKTMAKILFIWK